jgi:hypothetical protein
MFADLDESIRQLLVQRGNLDSGEIDIAFDMPTREWAAGRTKPTINAYLFDVRENTELRNPSPWAVRPGPNNTAIKRRPEVRVDLTYRITAFANAVEDEHRLLARALLTLLQNPVFPSELLQGEAAGQEINTEVAQPHGLIQSPADYWSVVDNDMRPSIDYKLTLRLDPNQEISVGLVLTSQIKLGLSANGDRPDVLEEMPLQIGGRVHDSADPAKGLAGATVTLVERGEKAVTDSQGRYIFRNVPPGTYNLLVSAPGVEQRREIQVPSGGYDVPV